MVVAFCSSLPTFPEGSLSFKAAVCSPGQRHRILAVSRPYMRLTSACASGPGLSSASAGSSPEQAVVAVPPPSTSTPSPGSMELVPLAEQGSCPALIHQMRFTEVSGLRRWLRGPRMLLRLRGRLSRGTILLMRLGGSLSVEDASPSLFMPAPKYPSLPSLMRALRFAAHDPRIAHIYLRVDPFECGWAKLLEVRRHLEYYCQSGKGLTVFMEGGGEKEYFLTCGLPNAEVYVPPEGNLGLRGFMASGSFVRGILDKIGVNPQVERLGKFKSAGDQLNRTSMSEEQRLVIDSLLEQIQEMFVKSVAHCKNLTEEEVTAILDKGFQSMQDYADAGLITGLKYEDEIDDELKLRFKRKSAKEDEKEILKRELDTVKLYDYVKRTTEKMLGIRGKQKIAIIRAVGAITGGKNGQSPVMGSTVGNESMLELFAKARDDDSVKAVILRVDSPGGSALASDIIWHAAHKLAEKKPVIASMVDVAASGGYYISMGLPIVAESATITGSIGVVTAKLSLEQLYKKIGFAKETLSRGRYAELLVDSRAFTSDEAEYFRNGAERAYKSFVTKAADSRGVAFDEMDVHAQGRVWTGKQAKENGLVDEIGGFWRAVELAKEKAGIKSDQFVRLEDIRVRQSLADRLGFGTSAHSASSSQVLKMMTSGEPLVVSEIDATLGSSGETGFMLNPLQKLAYVAILEVLSRVPGGSAFGSIIHKVMDLVM